MFLLELLQPAEGERGRHRALADGGRDPLRRSMADVARREETGPARLERERVAVERPAPGPLAAAEEQVGPGEDEACRVGLDALARAPLGVRDAADAEE